MAKGNKIEGGFSGLSQLKKTLPENSKGSKSNDHSNQSQGYKVKDSFHISMTKVPKDTREALKGFAEIDNFYLKLNQFARFEEGKPLFFKSTKGKVDFSITPNFGDFDFKKNLEKQEKSIKAIFGEKNTYIKDFKTSYRLVIGGEATVYETSMRLHHIYGIPYIPASGIKGVVRSYIITEKFDGKEEKALADKSFIDIFGGQKIGSEDLSSPKNLGEVETSLPMRAGKVTFFDAFPTVKPTLKVDIMTPHYGDYYSDKKNKVAPTDTQSPNPIPFLTVENTTFRFVVASKIEKITFKEKRFLVWFKKALKNHGLGAKTAVGYGYLDSESRSE